MLVEQALQKPNVTHTPVLSLVVLGTTTGVLLHQTDACNERKPILVDDDPWCQAQAGVLRSHGEEKVLWEPPVELSPSWSVCNVSAKRRLPISNGGSTSDGSGWTRWYYLQSSYCLHKSINNSSNSHCSRQITKSQVVCCQEQRSESEGSGSHPHHQTWLDS